MEHLMELVAASFARHGIDCPAVNRLSPQRNGISATLANPQATRQTPAALPEHNFRQTPASEPQHLQGDPAP
jgi:hypothetical protein